MTLQKGMTRATRQKACSACIKAKRRCDLRHPACRRCSVKGIDCQYASTRLHDRHTAVQRAATSSAAVAAISQRATSPMAAGSTESVSDMLFSDIPLEQYFLRSPSPLPFSPVSFSSSNLSCGSSGGRSTTDVGSCPNGRRRCFCQFFLAPNSWTLMKRPQYHYPRRRRDARDMTASVQHVIRWVRQWGMEGSTRFIHKHLWAERLPKCIQDAYTACAAYFARTEENRELVLRIIEERVEMLLREQEQGGDDGNGRGGMVSLADHVARVQALLVYQVIRLYDGDARQQAQAVALIPTLTAWNMQMLRCAGLSSEYLQSARSARGEGVFAADGHDYGRQVSDVRKQSAWQAWILAESVRRTWLVVAHVQCIYNVLRGDYSLCPGGLPFTTRAGLWDAPSAQVWWDRMRGQDVLFLYSLETAEQLPARARPEDVDDFGRFVLRIVADRGRMESWMGNEYAGGSGSDGAEFGINCC